MAEEFDDASSAPRRIALPVALPVRGRGAAENPANRFEHSYHAPNPDAEDPRDHVDDDGAGDGARAAPTQFLPDHSRSIIARNDSPDVGFTYSLNAYRGCEHGCIYCYARPTHETLGFSAGLDFESRILVKHNAPDLLRHELSAARWKPAVIAMSGVTDCYQPVERKLQLTRRCLETLRDFYNPTVIITKNHLVTRDIDILADMARKNAAAVMVSITTLRDDLARIMEPRTSRPQRRFEAVRALASAGVPVGVMVAPVIPALTDEEMPDILAAAGQAGAMYAGYTLVRLPLAVAPLFDDWLARHMPDRREKILNRIRAMREGRLNDADFGRRMTGQGVFAEQLRQVFALSCRRAGIGDRFPEPSAGAFRAPGRAVQMGLFGQ